MFIAIPGFGSQFTRTLMGIDGLWVSSMAEQLLQGRRERFCFGFVGVMLGASGLCLRVAHFA